MPHCFGIVGHGVVGSLFSRILSNHGARVLSYDCLLDHPETASLMQKKIEEDRSKACSLAEVLGGSDYILSVIPPQSCCEIADCASRSLHRHQVFVDLTSTSPAIKRMVAVSVTNGDSRFVEGVILGAVSSSISPVILLGGPAGENTAWVFQQYGLDARFYSPEIGRASAFKMLRSIFSKGFEAVLVETLVAARRAGLLNEIWEEIRTTLSKGKAEDTFQIWIRSHARSAQRRCSEMQEVSQFLDDIGIPPVLPGACAQVFARSFEFGVADAFPQEPESFREVIDYLERQQATLPRLAEQLQDFHE
jgi:3-hydroxyisobutyrate dehydrogenase-like beta-hydroxyacid dehydrogenase